MNFELWDLKCQFSTKCKCMLTHNKKIQYFKLLVGNKFKTVIVLKRRRKNLAQYFNPPKLNIYVQNICTGHSCYVNERSTCSVSGSGIIFFTKGSYTHTVYIVQCLQCWAVWTRRKSRENGSKAQNAAPMFQKKNLFQEENYHAIV